MAIHDTPDDPHEDPVDRPRTAVRSLRSRAIGLVGSDTRRGVISISGGTVGAQLVAAAATPVLTRLYSTEEYGTFFILFSLGLALGAGFALRFEMAVPLPKNDPDARSLVLLGALSTGGLLAITLLVAVLGRNVFSAFLDLGASPWIIVLVGPLSASFGLASLLNAVAVREARYQAIATRSLVIAGTTVALQLGAGAAGFGVVGLVVSALVAQLLGVCSLYLGSQLLRQRSDRSDAVEVLRRYRRFPMILSPAGLMNSFGANAPLFVVGGLYGADSAGRFGLATRIVGLPVSIVGAAIGKVFISELARRRREGADTGWDLLVRTSQGLAAVGFGIAVVVALLGPWAFGVVFGPEWEGSGAIARALALGAAAQLVASPVSPTLVVYERVTAQFVWDALRLIVTVGGLVVAWAVGLSVVGAIWVLSVLAAICYAANWELCRRTIVDRLGSADTVDAPESSPGSGVESK